MERIKLSKNEKQVMRLLAISRNACPSAMEQHAYNIAVLQLQSRGFVMASVASGGKVVAAELTNLGVAYLAEYPSLRNPINWAVVLSAITAVASIAALFIACGITK